MNKFKPGFFDRFPYTIPEVHLESVEYLRWRFFAEIVNGWKPIINNAWKSVSLHIQSNVGKYRPE